MITDTKEYTFDCAHQLIGYDGQCKNVHGHTYKLQVTVTGEIMDNGPKTGMIIDFNDLKDIVKKAILDDFDHAFIACGDEPILPALIEFGNKMIILGFKTTCENMVKYFAETIQGCLDVETPSIHLVKIQLWETPTSFAIWSIK